MRGSTLAALRTTSALRKPVRALLMPSSSRATTTSADTYDPPAQDELAILSHKKSNEKVDESLDHHPSVSSARVTPSQDEVWTMLQEANILRRRTRNRQMVLDLLKVVEEQRKVGNEDAEHSKKLARKTRKVTTTTKDKEERHVRLPLGVWKAMDHFDVSVVPFTKSIEEAKKEVAQWRYHTWFSAPFETELDWSQANRIYLPFWHFSCPTTCEYMGKVTMGYGALQKESKPRNAIVEGPFSVYVYAGRRHGSMLMNDVISKVDVWGPPLPSLSRSPSPSSSSSTTSSNEFSLKSVAPGLPLKRTLSWQDAILGRSEVQADIMYDIGVTPTEAWEQFGPARLFHVENEACRQHLLEMEKADGLLKEAGIGGGVGAGLSMSTSTSMATLADVESHLYYVRRHHGGDWDGRGPASVVMIPTYHLPYRWKGHDYYLCVNGWTGAVHGTMPYSRPKVLAVNTVAGTSASAFLGYLLYITPWESVYSFCESIIAKIF